MKGYKINIKNFHYALLEQDTRENISYENIQEILKIMEVTMTPNMAQGELYGDGAISDQQAILTSIGVTINLNKLPLKDRAKMLGNKYENGVLTENKDDKAPYLAMGFEIETTTGKSEFVWLLKGKLQPVTDELRQREGNITYNTNNITFLFIPRDGDGEIRVFADENDEELGENVAKDWFSKVPGEIGS